MFVILGPPPCLRMERMAPVVCSPKGRMRQLGFAELPGCLSVSSNDGGKGLPRLGEDGSFDWACTQLLGPRVHSRAAEGPLHLMKTSPKGIRTNPNSFLHSLLAKGCLDLL